MVLAASLLLAVPQPLMSGLFDERGTFDVFFSLLIVTVLVLVFEQREHRRVALSLGLAALASIWASRGFDGKPGRLLLVGARLLAAGFLAFALYRIPRAILVKQASGDAIFGVLVGYLLVGQQSRGLGTRFGAMLHAAALHGKSTMRCLGGSFSGSVWGFFAKLLRTFVAVAPSRIELRDHCFARRAVCRGSSPQFGSPPGNFGSMIRAVCRIPIQGRGSAQRPRWLAP